MRRTFMRSIHRSNRSKARRAALRSRARCTIQLAALNGAAFALPVRAR
jgi:hypothetical protein